MLKIQISCSLCKKKKRKRNGYTETDDEWHRTHIGY